jgi:hypothetical protein
MAQPKVCGKDLPQKVEWDMLSKRKKAAQTLDDSKGNPLPAVYDSSLQDLKDRMATAQLRAALSVNRELVLLYWSVGRDILTRQE